MMEMNATDKNLGANIEVKEFKHKTQKAYIEEALNSNPTLWGNDQAIADIVRKTIMEEAKLKGLEQTKLLKTPKAPSATHIKRTRTALEKAQKLKPGFTVEPGGPGVIVKPGEPGELPPPPTPVKPPTDRPEGEIVQLDLSSVQSFFESINDMLGEDKVPQKRVNTVALFWKAPLNRLLRERGDANTDILLAFGITALMFGPAALTHIGKTIAGWREGRKASQ